MLRVIRPEAGEEPVRVLRLAVLMVVRISKVIRPEAGEEPVRVLRRAVLMVVHHNRFYDRSPVGSSRTVDYFRALHHPTL